MTTASVLPVQSKAAGDGTGSNDYDDDDNNKTLLSLSASLATNPEQLLQDPIQPHIALNCAQALKILYDKSVASEAAALPSLSTLLHSALPQTYSARSSRRATRASTKRKRDSLEQEHDAAEVDDALAASNSASIVGPHPLFEPTPLEHLTVASMGAAQIWSQLELRGAKIAALVDAVVMNDLGAHEVDEEEEDDSSASKNVEDNEEDDDDDEEIGNLGDLSDAELRSLGLNDSQIAMIRESEELSSSSSDGSEDGPNEGYAGASDFSDEEEAGQISFEPLLSEREQQRRKREMEQKEMRRVQALRMLRGGIGAGDPFDSDEEDQEEEMTEEDQELLRLMEEEEESEVESEEETRAVGKTKALPSKSILDSLDEPGNVSKGAKRGSSHPTLDDSFFSIDDFNRVTERDDNFSRGDTQDDSADLDMDDAESGGAGEIDLFAPIDTSSLAAQSKARLAATLGAEDEDDEELIPADSAAGIRYRHFFDPPPRGPKGGRGGAPKGGNAKGKGKGKAKASEEVDELAGLSRPSTAAELSFDDDDELGSESDDEADPNSSRRSVVRFAQQVKVKPIKGRKNRRDEGGITPEILAALQRGGVLGDAEEGSEEEEEDGEEGSSEEEEEEADEGMGDGDEDEEMEDGEAHNEEEGEEEEEEDDDEEEEEEEEEADQEVQTARRVAGDLFGDDEDIAAPQTSTHEARLRSLKAEISKLEAENIATRDWTLQGEASSRVRPINSLLESDLDFEHTAKAVPVATEDKTRSLEELIKARILEGRWDDVVRTSSYGGAADSLLPARLLELSDQRSAKSLAELYEDEYAAARADAEGGAERPKGEAERKLEAERETIKALFEEFCTSLDALSSAHFTPKAPKAVIETLSTAPRITMETSLPTSSSSLAGQLAPEEIYAPSARSETLVGASSERTPAEARRLHDALRKDKRKRNDRIRATLDARERDAKAQSGIGGAGMGGKGRSSNKDTKAEKQEALRKLVGNKGVSVIGKEAQSAAAGRSKKDGARAKAASQATLGKKGGAGPADDGGKTGAAYKL